MIFIEAVSNYLRHSMESPELPLFPLRLHAQDRPAVPNEHDNAVSLCRLSRARVLFFAYPGLTAWATVIPRLRRWVRFIAHRMVAAVCIFETGIQSQRNIKKSDGL